MWSGGSQAYWTGGRISSPYTFVGSPANRERLPAGYVKSLKTIHSDQLAKLQAKNQQECELLEDIRNFMKQRSSVEKSYAESLIKISGAYLCKKVPPAAEVPKDSSLESCSVWQVWRSILDETEKIAKARLAACEVFQQQISEDAKCVRASKVQHSKKHLDQLKGVQTELQEQVQLLERSKKSYIEEEQEAHGIRDKARDAEEKLKKKKGGIFTSVSSLQKTSQKLGSRRNLCDEKSALARNEYILSLAATNAHQNRYFYSDLHDALQHLELNVYDKIGEYFSLLSRTELITWTAANASYTKIRDQTSLMNREHNINCYMTCYPVLKQHVTYDFDAYEDDPVRAILKDSGTMDVWKEAEKWVACQVKEKRKVARFQQRLDTYMVLKEAGNKVDPNDQNGTDLDTKIDEARQEIRKALTSKIKAEARIECLREGGVNVEEFYEKFNTKDSLDMPRSNSQLSLSPAASPAKFSNVIRNKRYRQEEPKNRQKVSAEFSDIITIRNKDLTESEQSDPFESDHDVLRSRSASTAADNGGFEYKDSDDEEDIANKGVEPAIVPVNLNSWSDPLAVDWGEEPTNPAEIVVAEKEGSVEDAALEPPSLTPSNFPVRCIALYTYEAQNPDELGITENEELEAVSDGDGDGWIRARNYRGEEGFVPQNYIALDSEPLQPPDSLQQQVSFSSVDYTYSESGADTVYNVTAVPLSEIVVPAVVEPTPLVEDKPLPHDTDTGSTYCRALYDFEASSPEEMSFFEGQVIHILRKQVHDVDDGWWEGRLPEDGTTGIFPSLMVEECDENGEPLNPVVDEPEVYDDGVPPCYTPPEIPTFLLPPDKVIVTQPTPETEQYMGEHFSNQYANEDDKKDDGDEDKVEKEETVEANLPVNSASILITAATPSLEGPTDESWEIEYSAPEPTSEQGVSTTPIASATDVVEPGIAESGPSDPIVTHPITTGPIKAEPPVVERKEDIDIAEVEVDKAGNESAIIVNCAESQSDSNQSKDDSELGRNLSFDLDLEKLQKLETLNESYA